MSDEIGKHTKLKPLCPSDLGVQISLHPPKNFLKDLILSSKKIYNIYRNEKNNIYLWASVGIGRQNGLKHH